MAEPKEPLTERELEIVHLLGTGMGNKDIAARLFLSPNTVKVHLRNIFTKLEATSRTEVTMMAIRNGWIAINQPAPDAIEQVITPATQEPEASSNGAAAGVSVTALVTESEPAATPVASNEMRARVAVTPSPVVLVPVAPNPQAIPPMTRWRRAVLLASLVVLVIFITLAIPQNTAGSSSTFDPLHIGPSQPKNGLLSRGEASRWYMRAQLPTPRARSVALTLGNRIYVVGGEVNQTVSADVMVYDPVSNTWTLLDSPKPAPVANTAGVAIKNTLYFAGGTATDGSVSNSFEAFDTTTNQWRELRPLPVSVAGHALAAFSSQIYLFGGSSDAGTTAASYRYDIATDTWTPSAAMPTPRSLMAAETVNDRIYVIGGFSEGHELTTCEYYTPAADAWATCAAMTTPRSGLGMARVGGNLFAIGGGATGFIGFNERYDTVTDRWTPLETPITSDWQSIAVASLPSEFFVFGGYSNGERLSFAYVYEVFTNRVYVPAFMANDNQGNKP